MRHVFIILGSIIGLVGLYILVTYIAELIRQKMAPREDMMLCDKHGLFLKKHCITFMDVPYCPRCFHEKQSDMEKV